MSLTLVLNKRDSRALTGHPWIFAGELAELPSADHDGEFVKVVDRRGKFIGQGILNTRSSIAVRLLRGRGTEPLTSDYFRDRLIEAIEYRKPWVQGSNAYRVVHSEADDLPGLVVDRYGDVLVLQISALASEKHRDLILETLKKQLSPRGIYERSDMRTREKEGLQPVKGVIYGECPDLVEIDKHGRRFLVDVANGQKTGFFLDQRLNRSAIAQLSAGKRVLNCFSYSGGFSIAAIQGGATHVHSMDISEEAIALGRQNGELNGYGDRLEWETVNVFDRLPEMVKEQGNYDVVILDPPAFTKSKHSLEGAIRGYKEINLRAMKLLPPGGILVTCSCSHHLDRDTFLDLLKNAAHDAYRRIRLIEERGASPDHPVRPGVPETAYLKTLILSVQ